MRWAALFGAALTLGYLGSASAIPSGGGFAGPARASGSSIYWNPAALIQHPSRVNAGLETTLLFAEAGYARAGVDAQGNPFQSVGFGIIAPNLDFNITVPSPTRHVKFVFGGFSPGAAAVKWPKNGPQRYVGTNNHLISYATVAGLAIGGGSFGMSATAGVVYNSLRVASSLDLAGYANAAVNTELLTYENPELEALLRIDGHRWSGVAQFGLWAQPTRWLRLGGSVRWVQDVRINGSANVTLPSSIDTVFPNLNLDPTGDVYLNFIMPWVFNGEAELRLRGINIALLMQYETKSDRNNVTGAVTRANPSFIEGQQIAVVSAQNDWMLGARLSREFGDKAEVGVRFDYDPRAISDEVLSVINLDFTQYEMSLATLWRFSNKVSITGTYGFVYIPTINVTNSLFNSRADVTSGLSRPSTNGRYSASAHRLTLSFQGSWGR